MTDIDRFHCNARWVSEVMSLSLTPALAIVLVPTVFVKLYNAHPFVWVLSHCMLMCTLIVLKELNSLESDPIHVPITSLHELGHSQVCTHMHRCMVLQ